MLDLSWDGKEGLNLGGPQVWWPPGEETITMRNLELMKNGASLEFGHQKLLQKFLNILKEHQKSLLVNHTMRNSGGRQHPWPGLVGRCTQELWAGQLYMFQSWYVASHKHHCDCMAESHVVTSGILMIGVRQAVVYVFGPYHVKSSSKL